WCGKTWTAEHHAASEIKLQDPAGNYQNRSIAQISPAAVLEGEKPRLIDEWQDVPQTWDAVRAEVDSEGSKGQFLLTGSSTPKHGGTMHSGAGRIARVALHTMSLFEMGYSDGKISLKDICSGTAPDMMTGEVKLQDLADFVIRGGWPENIGIPIEMAALVPGQYIDAIINDDASRIDNVSRDTGKMRKLLKSLARNECTTASNKTLMRDIRDQDGGELTPRTVTEYLNVFQKLFLLNDQPAYSSSMRSSVRVKQQPKRHFCDPSIAASLMNCSVDSLMNDLNTFGSLFESLTERDLGIYADTFNGKLYHYQDYKGREIDAVIELKDGNWCGFEVKLGAGEIDAAAENLLKISREFEADPKAKEPQALCVVCGMTNAAYRRPDGVYVVPITSLRD
ncbi:MAG: ATP-binding protein, partial [Anaerovoracaceae bacterium]